MREDTFEKALLDEHVEDKLINKQIILVDEVGMVTGSSRHFTYSESLGDPNDARLAAGRSLLDKLLPEISLLNRQRRNFRLLRDWTNGRPWARMYQLYDTRQPGYEWVAESIEWLWTTCFDSRGRHASPWSGFSGYRHLCSSMFGILPLEYTRGPGAEHVEHDICGVCNRLIEANQDFDSTVLELHCQPKGHLFRKSISKFEHLHYIRIFVSHMPTPKPNTRSSSTQN